MTYTVKIAFNRGEWFGFGSAEQRLRPRSRDRHNANGFNPVPFQGGDGLTASRSGGVNVVEQENGTTGRTAAKISTQIEGSGNIAFPLGGG
jgi:hypothetical protein